AVVSWRCVRTLKVKCPTWQHVETFYARKLRRDNTLTIRVPFTPQEGSTVTIGLQLPDGEVMPIEGKVLGIMDAPPGKKAAIRLHLHGMTEEVLGQLKAMVTDARRSQSRPRIPADGKAAVSAPSRGGAVPTMPPAPLPEDAPIDEVVEAPAEYAGADLADEERDVFEQLAA